MSARWSDKEKKVVTTDDSKRRSSMGKGRLTSFRKKGASSRRTAGGSSVASGSARMTATGGSQGGGGGGPSSGGGPGGGGGTGGSIGLITSGNEDVLAQIRADDPNLIKLSLYGRGLGDSGALRLSESLKTNTHLKVIDVGRNGITATGCAAISNILAKGTIGAAGLETLWIRENKIGPQGVGALSNALKSNETLIGASLGRNGIDEVGARHLALMLRRNHTLRQLWLYGNELGDNGTSVLAEALLVNRTLKEIYLGGNRITNEGAKHLGNVLVHNPSLTKVELFKNAISDEGAGHLADALKSNEVLLELNVRGNKIGVTGCSRLIHALDENPSLAYLDLRENAANSFELDAMEEHIAGLGRPCRVLIRRDQNPATTSQPAGGTTGPQRPGMAGSRFASYMDRGMSSRGNVGGGGSVSSGRTDNMLQPIPDEHEPPKQTLTPVEQKNLDSVCMHLEENDPYLIDVDMSDAGIVDAGLIRLAESMKGNTHLKSLDVRNCNITNEGVEALAAAAAGEEGENTDENGDGPPRGGGFGSIEELNLGWNDVLDQGAVALSLRIQSNGTLRTLLLNNAALGDEGAAALAELLRTGGTALEEMHLRHNSVGCDGVALLSAALLDNTTLRRILLGWNDVGQAGAEYVADALRTNRTVTLLDLDGNNIGPEGGASIAYGLRENDVLTAMWLGSNDLGDDGAKGVAVALTHEASALSQLDLEFNDISSEGVRPIAEALRDRPDGALMTLWLGGNRLGDEGAELLAEVVQVSQTLMELGIKFNDISHVGAQALADAMRDGASRLEILWLGGNPRLGDDGAAAIADMLCSNPPLSILSLDGCGITDEGASVLYSAMEENGTLTTLDLSGNAVGDMGVLSLIEHATKSNRANIAKSEDGEEQETLEELLYTRKRNEHKVELRLV